MFQTLKDLLPNTLAKYKLASITEASLICEEANRVITDILGKSMNDRIEALYVRDHTMAIAADSAQAIAELKLYTETIIEAIHAKFPQAQIQGLRFMLN